MKRIPWFRARKKSDPEIPLRLPLPVGPLSNGEFFHGDSREKKLIRKLVLEHADKMARKHNVDRREFLASAAGMCTTLAAINFVSACSSAKNKRMMPGSMPSPSTGGGAGTMGGGAAGMGGGVAGMGTSSGGGGMGSSAGAGGDPITMGESGMGGGFNMPDGATQDPDAAACAIGPISGNGMDMIVDMQSHFVNDQSPYLTNPLIGSFFNSWLADIKARFNDPMTVIQLEGFDGCSGNACYNRNAFVENFFLDGDTVVGVLSGIPYIQCAGTNQPNCDFAPLTNEDIRDAKNMINAMAPGRILSHAMIMPNDRLQAQLAAMETIAGSYGVNNWKVYPVWAPDNNGGYWLDDEAVGIPMIKKGIEVGVNIFCVHKGFPLSGFSRLYSDPKDIGVVAARFSRGSSEGHAKFVVYHSAFEHNIPGASGQGLRDIEGPYDPNGEYDPMNPTKYPVDAGVNSLVKSILDNGIMPNDPDKVVYAELGGVWPSLAGAGRTQEAMHVIGKLLKYLGEDRIVWGTDCLWFGSPQPFIEAFRAFEISQEFQDRYGYPALTPERKHKILGLNAARLQGISCNPADYPALANLKKELRDEWGTRRYMMASTPGPRTYQQFRALQRDELREKQRWSDTLKRLGG